MAWAAERPANEPLPIFEIPFNFHFSVKCGWTFIEEWALGRLGFVFGMSFRVGYRYWARGSGPWAVRIAKKVSPCYLYESTLLILSGILEHLRTFERKFGHLRIFFWFFTWFKVEIRTSARTWGPFLLFTWFRVEIRTSAVVTTLFILLYDQCGPRLQNFLQCGLRPFVRKVCPPLNYAIPTKLLCITCWKMDLEYLISLKNENLNPEKKSKQLWLLALLAFCPSFRSACFSTSKVLVRIKSTHNWNQSNIKGVKWRSPS